MAADDRQNDGRDVERYEQVRRQALGGDTSGWRLGLALLQHRGVAAWLRAWPSTAPGPGAPPSRPALLQPVGGDELVGVLATMALACVGGG